MVSSSPRVSVCVPTLNRAAKLRRTLRSLVAQEFRDLEIIVIDNHSDDDGAERAVAELADPRVRYIRQPTRVSMGENWNRGLEEARGAYVGIFHDDDHYYPEMLKEAVERLDADPDLAFVHAATRHVSEDREPLRVLRAPWPSRVSGAEFQRVMALHPGRGLVEAQTVTVRRDAYRAAGAFRSGWVQAADIEMWLRLAGTGAVGYDAEPRVDVEIKDDAHLQMNVDALCERAEVWDGALSQLRGLRDRCTARLRVDAALLRFTLWLALNDRRDLARDALGRISPRLSPPARLAGWLAIGGPLAAPLLAGLKLARRRR